MPCFRCREQVERLAKNLLERETLNATEIKEIMEGKKVDSTDESSEEKTLAEHSKVSNKDKKKPKSGTDGAGGIVGSGGFPDPQPA